MPGSRPELFLKAFASPSDALSFDLEDAVEPSRKSEARSLLGNFLCGLTGERRQTIIVRVNPLDSDWFADDLAAVVCGSLDAVNLPKVTAPDDVREAAEHLTRIEKTLGLGGAVGILANIETPAGLRHAAEIAAADPRVIGLQLGFGDLFEPNGISRRDTFAVRSVQLAVRLAAAEADLPAYDGAYTDVGNPDGFRQEAQAARQLGFAGKSCIHPSQVPLANAAFAPTEEELVQARRVLSAAETHFANGIGAFLLDGVMIDAPFVEGARAVVGMRPGDSND